MSTTCPSCAASVDPDARFCVGCGTPLSESTSDDATAAATTEAPVEPQAPGLVACPWCGAVNASSRTRCARCRADLRTGEQSPRPAAVTGEEELAVGDPDGAPLPGVLVLGAVVVAVAVAAVALTLLSARGVGPFADPQDPLTEPSGLDVAQISASSALEPEGSRTYGADNLVDGDPTTAWSEGVPGNGVGERIDVELATPAQLTGLLVWNGYQDGDAFLEHPRVAELELTIGGRTFGVTLLDRRGPQSIDLPEPIRADEVGLEIVRVFPGDRYNDTAVSELTVRGVPVDGSG